MAGCSPDLDDGELFLPSGIFPDEADDNDKSLRRRLGPSLNVGCSSEVAYMEDLAMKLAALGLLERSRRGLSIGSEKPMPRPGFSPHLDQPRLFHPAAREPEVPSRYGRHQPPSAMGPFSLCRTPANAGYNDSGRAMYPLNLVKPSGQQVSDLGRAAVMHRRQQTDAQNWLQLARLSGVRRECGGTGVFLPRVMNDSVTNNTAMKYRGGEQRHYQQQQILHHQHQQHRHQQYQHQTMGGSSRGEVMWRRPQGTSNQPLSEPCLPQDWTY